MKQKTNSILIMLVLFVGILTGVKEVKADGTVFDVQPIMSDHQKKEIVGWFNTEANPGEEKVFQLKINNRSNKKIKVVVIPTDATTADSGEMIYTPYKGKLDPSLKYRFPDLTSKQQTLSIAPNGYKIATYTVKIPKEAKNIMIMGGFYITQADSNPSKKVVKKTDKQQVQIRNYYSYAVAAVLTVGKPPKPDMKLVSVAPGMYGGYASFGARLQNDKANYLSNVKINARVTQKKSGKTVTSRKQDRVGMTANSNFTYNMQIGKFSVEPGVYHLDFTAVGPDKKWHFSRDFEVTRRQAKELNDANLLLPKSHFWLYVLIAVVVVLLFVGIVVFFYFRGQNKARMRLENSMKNIQSSSDSQNKKNERSVQTPKRRRK